MYNLIKSFLNLFIFKTKPEDIVYSKSLLVFLVVLDLIINYIANIVGIKIFNSINKQHNTLIIPSMLQSLIIISVLFLVLWGLVYTVLTFYHKRNRYVQILTSLVAVDIIFRILIIAAMIGLKYSPFLAIVVWLPVMYWQFILYIFIFANGFGFTYLNSGLFTLCYMLIQHNLGELLVNYVCR